MSWAPLSAGTLIVELIAGLQPAPTPAPSPQPQPSPELWGMPVATLAFVVALLSFSIALVALAWQIVKHFLDGGRVRVYLNTAIWEPEFMIATNRSGVRVLQNDNHAQSVTHGRALELAQLVVENPGKVPVTIYSPGLSLSGHGIKNHTLTPRTYTTDDENYGADRAVDASSFRLDPYARVTFLLDYWSVMPGVLEKSPKGQVYLRGYVGVAGRSRRPQLSSRRLRWLVKKGEYTAIEGSPDFAPIGVLWRSMYGRLPKSVEAEKQRHPEAGPPVTRGMLHYLLDEAMSKFDERPEREMLQEELESIARSKGDRFPMVGIETYHGYEALDRMEGHLAPWTKGLWFRHDRDDTPDADENSEETGD